MPWFDRHRRHRDSLSAYLDGELDVATRERLERHLEGCDACRAELDQLRATAAALRELPAPVARRSFALTPEQVAAPRRPSPLAARPLDYGMRIAAAGVAVALAAVVIVDAGGLTGDGAEKLPQTPAMEADAGTPGLQGQLDDRFYGSPAAEPDEPVSSDGEDDAGGAGGPTTGGDVIAPGGTPTPEPAGGGVAPSDGGAEPAGSPTAEPGFGGELRDADETPATETPAADTRDETPPEGETATNTNAFAAPSDGGGIGALTVAEIALAVALAALVASSVGLAYARRRG